MTFRSAWIIIPTCLQRIWRQKQKPSVQEKWGLRQINWSLLPLARRTLPQMSLQNSIYIPLKISYDTDGLVCIRNPSDGPLNHHLAEREHMIPWVRSIYKVFKYTRLICKIWGFTERWITCSENKIHINSKTLFFFSVLVFRNFHWKFSPYFWLAAPKWKFLSRHRLCKHMNTR